MTEFQERILIHAPIQRCFDLARNSQMYLAGRKPLTSELTRTRPPAHFQSVARGGPFRFIQTDQYFRVMPSGATEMFDRFRFEAAGGLFGRLIERLFWQRYMPAADRKRLKMIKKLAEQK